MRTTRSAWQARSSRGRVRPSGRTRPLLPLDEGRYRDAADECIERDGLCDGRSAKPRGAVSEWRVELRPTRHRAASHNGARYAFVHPKARPAKTQSAPWGSHAALSGPPPRCLQAEKSGSRARHTFRPSGNPSGWNRKRSVPLALLPVNSNVIGDANAAASLRGPRAASRWSALEGERPLRPRSPLPQRHPSALLRVTSRHSPLIPVAVTKAAEHLSRQPRASLLALAAMNR
jgi:hypothetical protein